MFGVEDTRLERHGGGTIHLSYRADPDRPKSPTVIFSHGFTANGTDSHRMFLRMARRYNQLGVATVNFDYYGCGYSDGEFSEFSVTNAVSDLSTVIDWVRDQPFADPERIIIHGHSLGTAIATVVGSRRGDICGYVLWNFSADLSRRYRAMLGEDLLTNGFTWVWDTGLLVRRQLIDDMDKYDIMGLMASWKAPTLFVTSGDDTTGEPGLAERANDIIGELGSRVVIAGANHSFKCQPEQEEQAAKASVDWLSKHVTP